MITKNLKENKQCPKIFYTLPIILFTCQEYKEIYKKNDMIWIKSNITSYHVIQNPFICSQYKGFKWHGLAQGSGAITGNASNKCT